MLVFTGFPSPSCSTKATLALSVLPEPLPDVPAVGAGSAGKLAGSSDACNAGCATLGGLIYFMLLQTRCHLGCRSFRQCFSVSSGPLLQRGLEAMQNSAF